MDSGGCQQQQQHAEAKNEDDDASFDMVMLDQFDYIRFTLTDMNGIGRCMSVPRRHVEHCLHGGLGFYAGKPTYQSIQPGSSNNRTVGLHMIFKQGYMD